VEQILFFLAQEFLSLPLVVAVVETMLEDLVHQADQVVVVLVVQVQQAVAVQALLGKEIMAELGFPVEHSQQAQEVVVQALLVAMQAE
jgi:hypothetical protein